MNEDGYLAAIERILHTGRAALNALTASLEAVDQSRNDRLAGASVDTILEAMLVRGGPTKRRAASAAWGEYEHAVMMLRAESARALVDEQGMSFTQIAEKWSVSRQLVARLYHQAPEGQS